MRKSVRLVPFLPRGAIRSSARRNRPRRSLRNFRSALPLAGIDDAVQVGIGKVDIWGWGVGTQSRFAPRCRPGPDAGSLPTIRNTGTDLAAFVA